MSEAERLGQYRKTGIWGGSGHAGAREKGKPQEGRVGSAGAKKRWQRWMGYGLMNR